MVDSARLVRCFIQPNENSLWLMVNGRVDQFIDVLQSVSKETNR
jgi:hypothetical protein